MGRGGASEERETLNSILNDDFLKLNFPAEQDYQVITKLNKCYLSKDCSYYLSGSFARVKTYERGYFLQIGDSYYKLTLIWEDVLSGDSYDFDFDPEEQYFFFQPVELEFATIFGQKYLYYKDLYGDIVQLKLYN